MSCEIDDQGSLKALEIDPSWWRAVGPQGIAAAILDAFRFAAAKVTAAGMIRARHGFTDHVGASHRSGSDHSVFEEALRRRPAEGIDGIWRSLDLATAALAEAERNHRALEEMIERATHRRYVSGPDRLFRLVLSGDEIVGAEAREELLGSKDGPRLAADARAAFGAAHRARVDGGRR